ncbi:MAG: cytochrome c [Deltaproteobacteria bacterium]|nr:cytochrome c [Deltaproteobacteria bacterium]
MLSKSAAKTFFLGGTALCAIAFVLLTVDTVGQLDERSHFEKFTPEAKHGYELYLKNNCMGCHTLLGEGAYYAPELTKVLSRRGEIWIKAFLQDPAAMYPNRRKMVKYDMFDKKKDPKADENIKGIIEFFKWVEKIDTNGFPPEPDLGRTLSNRKDGTKKMMAPESFTICLGCHAIGGKGGAVGPSLDGVANRYTPDELTKWLKSPETVKPGTAMPNLNLSDDTVQGLVKFLSKQE